MSDLSDENLDVENVVTDPVNDSPFDDEQLEAAAEFGVDPDAFEDEDTLEEAIYKAASRHSDSGKKAEAKDEDANAKPNTKPKADPEALALEAYKVDLGEDFEPKLLAELQKFSDAQTKRFNEAIAKLTSQHREEITGLQSYIENLGAAEHRRIQLDDFRKLDRWADREDDRKAFLGSERSDEMRPNSKTGRRKINLMKKAYKIRATLVSNGETVPSPGKLFDMAFAKMTKSKIVTKPKKDDKPMTRTARAGSSAKPVEKTAENQKEREMNAGARIDKWKADRARKFTRTT